MGVALTKQAIATRLLKHSVVSYLRGDDALAIYLTASSAARLVADLLEKSGTNWLESLLKRSLFLWARDMANEAYDGPIELADMLFPLSTAVSQGEVTNPQSINFGRLSP